MENLIIAAIAGALILFASIISAEMGLSVAIVEKRIKRLVVTDKERRLVGMVSRESILNVLAKGRL